MQLRCSHSCVTAGGGTVKIRTAVGSSVGMKRKINQDNFYINGCINKRRAKAFLKGWRPSEREQVLSVCDGMGGEQLGEVASLIAVEGLGKYSERYSNLFERFHEHVEAYVQSANRAVCSFAEDNGGIKCGSTVALLCISPKKAEAVAANVGDTKIYFYSDGKLNKVSVDHNVAQSLVTLGVITQEEARVHRDKSKLTQYLGIEPARMQIEAAISDNIMLKKGDMFLMCSDGLTDMMDEQQIKAALETKCSLKKKCKMLVDCANSNGGKDNVTVVLAGAE